MQKNTNAMSSVTANLDNVLDKLVANNLATVEQIKQNPVLWDEFTNALYSFVMSKAFTVGKAREKISIYEKKVGCANEKPGLALDIKHGFYLKMFSEYTSGDNKGKIWMDVLFEKPRNAWVPTIYTSAINFVIDLGKKKNEDLFSPMNEEEDEETDSPIANAKSDNDTANEAIAHASAQETSDRMSSILETILDELNMSPLKLTLLIEVAYDKDLKCRSKELLQRMRAFDNPEQMLRNSLEKLSESIPNLDIEALLEKPYNWDEIDALLAKENGIAEAYLSRLVDKMKHKLQSSDFIRACARENHLKKAS